MSPIAKLNAGTFICIVCLILLPNASALGGATFRPTDSTSISRTSPHLTL